MRITGRSSNVEDRRGMRGPLIAGGGVGALVIAVVVMLLGGDPREVLLQTGPAQQPAGPGQADPESEFVRGVLYETEQTWNAIFRERLNRDYEEPTLVLFSGGVQSACGIAQAAVGPFYCPLDKKVYIDLAFYRDLKERFGAPGDAAQAYVIAHEVGHHVQNQLGVLRSRLDNEGSIRQELQADCLAGVWASQAHRERQILESGDVDEALGAASAVGDDRLQRRAQGYVVPESFTHGSSAQRVESFRRGLDSGDMRACGT
jgi:predicted metalloprotease